MRGKAKCAVSSPSGMVDSQGLPVKKKGVCGVLSKNKKVQESSKVQVSLLGRVKTVLRGGVIFMAERRKSTKKVAENRKKGKNSAENRKKKCAGNRKMTFLSHGKPENLKIFAENGKLFFKAAETGKHF